MPAFAFDGYSFTIAPGEPRVVELMLDIGMRLHFSPPVAKPGPEVDDFLRATGEFYFQNFEIICRPPDLALALYHLVYHRKQQQVIYERKIFSFLIVHVFASSSRAGEAADGQGRWGYEVSVSALSTKTYAEKYRTYQDNLDVKRLWLLRLESPVTSERPWYVPIQGGVLLGAQMLEALESLRGTWSQLAAATVDEQKARVHHVLDSSEYKKEERLRLRERDGEEVRKHLLGNPEPYLLDEAAAREMVPAPFAWLLVHALKDDDPFSAGPTPPRTLPVSPRFFPVARAAGEKG